MNKLIPPYLIGLLKENILYIGLNAGMIVLIGFFLLANSKTSLERGTQINSLSKEVRNLERRITLFNQASLSNEDLDSNIKMLTALVPNSEDYFSIIYALETLSQKTGFIITSYTIKLGVSTKNRLRLSITGTGDKNAFLKFLNDYNFGGGRLMTSDKIELTPQISGQIKIDVTFYTKDTSTAKSLATPHISGSFINQLSLIREKVKFDLKTSTSEGTFDLNYPRKTNPF